GRWTGYSMGGLITAPSGHPSVRLFVVPAFQRASPLNDRLRDDPPVDLLLPGNLLRGELPLVPRLHQELVLALEDVAEPVGMPNQVFVRVRADVARDALETREEVARLDADETVDVDVADVRLVPVEAVADEAVLLDFVAAGALVPFLADLHGEEGPFMACGREVPRNRQRQNMSLEALEVVSRDLVIAHGRDVHRGSFDAPARA